LPRTSNKAKIIKQNKPEDQLTWQDLEIGSIATQPGNAIRYKTGDWSSRQPNVDFNKCIKCGICQVYCPEGCIKLNEKGFYLADLYHCKGCGVCAKECPKKAITMVEEKE
jgi:pyruvate ferredoxin oxidoreductase delta subunit